MSHKLFSAKKNVDKLKLEVHFLRKTLDNVRKAAGTPGKPISGQGIGSPHTFTYGGKRRYKKRRTKRRRTKRRRTKRRRTRRRRR